MEYRQKKFPVLEAMPAALVSIDDGFWTPRLEVNRKVSLFHQYDWLVKSGVFENFRRAAGKDKSGAAYQGLFFADSDAYKWLEAASLSLIPYPDPRLEAFIGDMIDLIASAQEECGYINTYFQLVEPDKKFTNFGVCHELYTAGHLIQAAVAHFAACNTSLLLTVACRLADHLVEVFGPGKLEAVDGHAEIEMALVSLYRVTGRERYLQLALFFINQRGNPDSHLRWELAHLEEIAGKLGKPGQNNLKHYGSYENYDGRYAQDHLPVREQTEAVGHAVRAMYLYCGMADVAAETGDVSLLAALEHLWQHLTTRRMYITGGIGPARSNEGFTSDFDLPNDSACSESCAAAGLIMWNSRMFYLTGDSCYTDLIERVLYNVLLAGVSLDGKGYFYNNPLQSSGGYGRAEWYECACCPSNISRVLASLNTLIYSWRRKTLMVNLYIQSHLETGFITGAQLDCRLETNYPWDGRVTLRLDLQAAAEFRLLLRIPGWCRSYCLKLNGDPVSAPLEKGYAVMERLWHAGDCVELDMAMPAEQIAAHPGIWQDSGRVAIQRGPLIYCLEDSDQVAVNQIFLPEDIHFQDRYREDLLGGIVTLEGQALQADLAGWEGVLYQPNVLRKYKSVPVRAIPYYGWGNRGAGAMTVWLPQKN